MSEEQPEISEGVNALLLDRSDESTGQCCDALLDVGAADDRAELTVSFPDDITDREGFDNGTTGRQPAKRGHVTIGDVLRSADESPPNFEDPVASEIVEDPTDLKAIGTSVSRFCEVWAESGHRMVLCFDSLTELLDHVEPKVAFQFLHTLLERLASVDTVAHFHIDPAAVDQQTLSTFNSLFEEVIDPDDVEALLDALDADGAKDAAEIEAEPESEETSLNDGIPATSGSSQASDGDIAARLDDRGEECEVANGRADGAGASRQASDDEVADRIPDVGDDE